MNALRRFTSAYADAFSGIPRVVWLLAGAALVNRAGTMVLPFLSLYLTHDIGLTAARAGQIIGCFGLGSMAGSYLGGRLSDRLGAMRVQQLSLFLSGVGFLLFIRLKSFSSLAVGVLVLATISEAFRPAIMSAVAQYSGPDHRARSFALLRLAVNLGMAIGPAVAGYLAYYGYAWLFVGDALTCWAAGLILVVVFRGKTEAADLPARSFQTAGNSPWRDGPFLLFLLLICLLGMTFFQVWSTMPIFLREFYHSSERAIGGLLSINALLIVIFEMLLIRAVEHLDRMRVVAIGALLVGAGLALLPLGPPYAVAVLAIAILTLGEMLALPIANVIVAERAGTSETGKYMGAYTLAFSTAFVFGPVAGTAIYEHVGADVLWYSIGALGLLLALAFAALSKPLKKTA